MKSLILKLEKLRLNRFQRLLLLGSVTLWFLSIVLSMQRNYQDSWILEGIFWPFVGFIVTFLVVLWMEDDNRWVAIVCAWAVIVILLVPSLKYKQVYGETIDAVTHYRIINDLITIGRVSPNIYQAIAGMHSWLASMGITSGLSTSDTIKFGFPLSGGIFAVVGLLDLPADTDAIRSAEICYQPLMSGNISISHAYRDRFYPHTIRIVDEYLVGEGIL